MNDVRKACEEAGCHDFSRPLVVCTASRWFPFRRMHREVVVAICTRCGARASHGWTVMRSMGQQIEEGDAAAARRAGENVSQRP